MGQHKLKVPDGNKSQWERNTEKRGIGKLLFMARELIVVPVMKLGTNKPSGQVRYAAARTGTTYRRDKTKPLSRRDAHRAASGTLAPNSWGADWYFAARERSEAGAKQRDWFRLQSQASA